MTYEEAIKTISPQGGSWEPPTPEQRATAKAVIAAVSAERAKAQDDAKFYKEMRWLVVVGLIPSGPAANRAPHPPGEHHDQNTCHYRASRERHACPGRGQKTVGDDA